jgi:hypothetical protein
MKNAIVLMLLALGLFACDKTANSTADQGQAHGELVTADSTKEEAAEETAENLPDPDAVGTFGAAVSAEGAILGADLLKQLKGKDSVHVKVKGEIASCCQAKGCWMKMPLDAKNEMMVKFKDYGFFVPKNSAGKGAIIEGWAYRELVSVEELQHYAQDAGQTEEEIKKINKPEERITFMADGVLVEPTAAEGAH